MSAVITATLRNYNCGGKGRNANDIYFNLIPRFDKAGNN